VSLSSFIFTVRRASRLNDAISKTQFLLSARIACVPIYFAGHVHHNCQHDKERDRAHEQRNPAVAN
jgi:hypothetical protein